MVGEAFWTYRLVCTLHSAGANEWIMGYDCILFLGLQPCGYLSWLHCIIVMLFLWPHDRRRRYHDLGQGLQYSTWAAIPSDSQVHDLNAQIQVLLPNHHLGSLQELSWIVIITRKEHRLCRRNFKLHDPIWSLFSCSRVLSSPYGIQM